MAISRDITEQSQAEETLRASETKYRIVADYTYDWEYRRTPDGRFAYVSPSCERMTGYAASEFQADPDLLFRIVHPDDKMLVTNHSERIGQQQSLADEVQFRLSQVSSPSLRL